MADNDLARFYHDYIACLNRQDWENLGRFVAEDVVHNGKPLGLHGYRTLLVEDFRAIPDLRFVVDLLVCEGTMIASRLVFDCTPIGRVFERPVHGRRVRFSENVFYAIEAGRIRSVWSVIDKAAIVAQI